MIEKKIHYCWFGGKKLPKEVKKCIKTWKKYCPDYEIIKWDESNFDVNANPFTKDAYSAKAWAFISDYARLKIIYEEGGIYLDTDVELVKNLDGLLKNKCYFAQQQDGNYIATGLGFGAEKNTSIIKEMMDVYDSLTFDNNKKAELACPLLNTAIIKKYGEYKMNEICTIDVDVIIYPPQYFDPIAPGDSQNLMCKDTYSIHHYSASWTSYSSRLKRKLVNAVGQHRVNILKEKVGRKR